MKCWPGCASVASTTKWYIVTVAAQLILMGSSPLGIIHLVFTIASLVYLARRAHARRWPRSPRAVADHTSAAVRRGSGPARPARPPARSRWPGSSSSDIALCSGRGANGLPCASTPVGVRLGRWSPGRRPRCAAALEDRLRDLGPRHRRAAVGDVVGAVAAPDVEQVPGGADELVGEGEPADLVVDDARRDALARRARAWCARSCCRRRSPTTCAAGSAAAPCRRRCRRRPWTGRRRRAGDSGSSSVCSVGGAVEDVLRGVVHEREAVLAGEPGQGGGRGGVGRPGGDAVPRRVSAASTAV